MSEMPIMDRTINKYHSLDSQNHLENLWNDLVYKWIQLNLRLINVF